jgi:branched-subunit amino acid transport protein
MSRFTEALVASAAVTAALRAVGPVALGGRQFPPKVVSVIALVGPCLFAALFATGAFANGDRLAVGADTAGVLAGGFVAWRGLPIPLVLVVAAATTAGIRVLS